VKKQQDFQKELKSRNEAIDDLQKKIDRSREIDLEVERKERELLR
jgi:peptidoglycan hydrolase CwlO-like protein